jgi:hypothetical protein
MNHSTSLRPAPPASKSGTTNRSSRYNFGSSGEQPTEHYPATRTLPPKSQLPAPEIDRKHKSVTKSAGQLDIRYTDTCRNTAQSTRQ